VLSSNLDNENIDIVGEDVMYEISRRRRSTRERAEVEECLVHRLRSATKKKALLIWCSKDLTEIRQEHSGTDRGPEVGRVQRKGAPAVRGSFGHHKQRWCGRRRNPSSFLRGPRNPKKLR
jgi:hypothetical protein